MVTYTAPVAEMIYLIDLFNKDYPGYIDNELTRATLIESSRFCEKLLLPINTIGDEDGCRYVDGQVELPPVFLDAYKEYARTGWPRLGCQEVHGGLGLPHLIRLFTNEMMWSSNISFGIIPAITYGVYRGLILNDLNEDLSDVLCALATGSHTGTMCLTEPESGSDLSLVRTKAIPEADGTYRLSGCKMFISGGDHDLTQNIHHLVLAKLPDAPEGLRGLSLFLVSKYGENSDDLGIWNNVSCGRIENKMGLHASPTCLLHFDGAKGRLVGLPHQGLKAISPVMLEGRLQVANQSVGLMEIAYQQAVAYARERKQFRSIARPADEPSATCAIIHHYDVKRMLLNIRARKDGCRALGAWIALQRDMSERHTSREQRLVAENTVKALTPALKVFFSETAFECINLSLQIMGAYGYIRETGMEQHLRDARIAQIYEGTNAILSQEFANSSITNVIDFCDMIYEFLDEKNHPHIEKQMTAIFTKCAEHLYKAANLLRRPDSQRAVTVARTAPFFCRLFGLVSVGYMWLMQIHEAHKNGLKSENDKSRVKIGTYYIDHILPQTEMLFNFIATPDDYVCSFPEEWL